MAEQYWSALQLTDWSPKSLFPGVNICLQQACVALTVMDVLLTVGTANVPTRHTTIASCAAVLPSTVLSQAGFSGQRARVGLWRGAQGSLAGLMGGRGAGVGTHVWGTAVKGKGSEERGVRVGAGATSTLVTQHKLDLLQMG